MRADDLRKFMARGLAAQGAAQAELAAYTQHPQPTEAWHRFAVQIELRTRTLRASIRAHEDSSAALVSLIDVLEIEASKLRRALEPKTAALPPEQHNAFPKGRWAVVNGGAK